MRIVALIRVTPALVALLTGCAVGPDFERPVATGPTRYTAATLADSFGRGAHTQRLHYEHDIPGQWWHLFQSPPLDALVREALANSPTLAQARARLDQARATLAAETGARLLPHADLNVSGVRQKVDPSAMGITPPEPPTPFTLYNASVSVAYTLDIFGGQRRALEASAAETERAAYEWQAARMTLAGNVITSALSLAGARDELVAAQALAQAQQHQLTILKNRYAAGGVSEREWHAQATLLAQTEGQLPALRQVLALHTHQLALYLGRDPSSSTGNDLTLASLHLPSDIPLSLPSTLARQRPDILAAEAAWHQAAADVGVATANLYPKLTLSAGFGSQRTHFDTIADGVNVWNLGLGLTQPLFHGGELRARKRGAEAAYQGAAAAYRQTVLQGLQQVADSLRALEHHADALDRREQAQAHSQAVYAIAEKQYQAGGISQLTLLDAQRDLLRTRRERIQSLTDRYLDTAALMQALGGGWWNEPSPDSPPSSAASPPTATRF